MGSPHTRRVVLLTLLTVVPGCSVDLAVHGNPTIRCSAVDRTCPDGYTCRTEIELCVKDGTDDTPPVISDLAVTPALVGYSEVVITFAVDEALQEEPSVLILMAGGESAEASFVSGDGTYRFRFLPTGDEPQDFASVAVEVVNTAGLVGRALASQAIRFDTVNPSVVEPSLRLFADLGNPLVDIGALRDGASALLTFYSDEPLGEDPIVRAVCDGGELAFSRLAGEVSTTFFTYELGLRSTDVANDGPCDLEIDLRDLAGNPGHASQTGGLSIDRTAPTAAAISAQYLRHVRVPYGAERTGGIPAHFLAPIGYVESDALPASGVPLDCTSASCIDPNAFAELGEEIVAARIFSDASGGDEIGRTEATAAGASPVRLGSVDARQIWVSALDSAGNESPRVRVPSGRWIATMGGKVPGSGLPNPHRLVEERVFSSALREIGAVEVDRSADLGETGNSLPTTGAAAWLRLAETSFGALQSPAAAYDRARGQVVMFGGGTGSEGSDATRVFDGRFWSEATVFDPEGDAGPGPRAESNIAYDALRGVVVLYGGRHLSDVWEWNGTSWRRRIPADPEGDGNPAVTSAAMTYDAARGEVLLFGGYVGADWRAVQDVLWAWNGRSWAVAHPGGGASPPAGQRAAMAYDPLRERVVLYGGTDFDASVFDELWEWDGSRWIERCSARSPCSPMPPPIFDGQAVWDARRERIVITGGCNAMASWNCDGFATPDAETWTWDGSAWDRICDGVPARDVCGTRPDNRWAATGAYDELHQSLLVAGGFNYENGGGVLNWLGVDTLTRTWAVVRDADEGGDGYPGSRNNAVAAYNPSLDQVWLMGGNPLRFDSPTSYRSDIWAWDGADWVFRCDSSSVCVGGTPTPTFSTGDYDPNTGRLIYVVGTTGANVWAWNGASWSTLYSGGTVGTLRYGGSAFDSNRNRLVLFGGDRSYTPSNELWEFNGISWTQRCVNPQLDPCGTGPGARLYAAMAFDDVRDVVVLFGGQNARYDLGTTVYGDTWEWNGSVWSQITPLDLEGDGDPGARGGASMAWDPTHQRVLMFGGFSPDGFYDDLWAWDGQSWQLVETAVGSRSGQPSHRRGAAMTYHTGNDELMLLGGESGGINQADTWLLDFSDNARPAQRIRFDLSTAGITPAAECRRSPSDCSVERIRARWDAGGDGWQAGSPQPGSRLLVWTDLGWIQGGQHDASGASPASLTWETTDVSVIGGTIVEDPHSIYLAVVSRGENGAWPERASVVSDYAELAVDYRVRDICGDARRGQDEACDDGNLLDGDGCDSNCTPTSCGNGIVVSPEECDDGNTVDADGCSASCVVE